MDHFSKKNKLKVFRVVYSERSGILLTGLELIRVTFGTTLEVEWIKAGEQFVLQKCVQLASKES